MAEAWGLVRWSPLAGAQRRALYTTLDEAQHAQIASALRAAVLE